VNSGQQGTIAGMTSTTSPPDTHPGWAPLVAVCLGTFMLLVDVTIVNVALPDMALDLHASFAGLQWVVDIYALALAALLLIVGSVSDVVGRRRTYVIGLGVFVTASLICGLAPSEGVLVAARAVQGIGAAGMFATTIALINTSYSGRARGVAFGIWGATNGAAAAAGPIVGGLLTQSLSWRWVFFVNVPIGLATIVVARRALAETRPTDRPAIDWAGGAMFTLASAAATFALVRANDEGWTSAATLGILAVALAALAAFVAIELRSRAPMLDLALLRRGPLAGILVAAVLYSAVAFSALVYASIWLQTVLGLGPIAAGLVTLPLSALAFTVAAGVGRLLHGTSPRLVLGGGLALIAAGDLLQVGLGGGSDWPRILAGLAVVGVGVGAMSPVLASAAMAAVAQERSGMAAGAVNTARQLGLAIGIAILGGVFSSKITDHLAVQPHGSSLADATASGGAQGILAHAPAAARGHLDTAIHAAVGSALGTTFLVAGIAGMLGSALVAVLMRERRGVPATTQPSDARYTAAAL
jgi:EmrB/QacA subfamily drug resistance transporter